MIAREREQFLQRLASFSDLDARELRALAEVAHIVQFPAAALIFREGEVGDCACVVVRGSAPVFAIDPIVSLGLVSGPAYLVVLEAAVALLVVQAIIINRLTGVRYPLWASVPAPKIGARAGQGALQRFAHFLLLV